MSKRTDEDVEKERRLEKMSRNLGDIKDNTRLQTDGSAVFSGILGGIGSLFRPLRKPLPRSINYVIDVVAGIIAIGGFILAIFGGWWYASEVPFIYGMVFCCGYSYRG